MKSTSVQWLDHDLIQHVQKQQNESATEIQEGI